MINKKFAVIGLGEMGLVIAKNLAKRGVEVMAIDRDVAIVDSIANDVPLAIALDATDKKALISQNITDFDAVIVLIKDDFEQNLLCCALLLELEVKRVITRVSNPTQERIMKKLGVKETLSIENEMGKVVFELLLNKSIVSCFQLTDDYEVVEVIPPKKVVNQTIFKSNLRQYYNINLITIKKRIINKNPSENDIFENDVEMYKIYGIPDKDMEISASDRLVLFGKKDDIDKFIESNN